MFVHIDLARPFSPRQDNQVYGMDQLLDMAAYPRARAITFFAITDSSVNAALTVRVVGSDGPDPNGGFSNLGESQVSTANKFSRMVFSINMAAAPFPFYGLTFDTTPVAPSAGVCWAYALIWWGE